MRVYEIAPGLYQSRTPTKPEDVRFHDESGESVAITAVIDLEGDIDPNVPEQKIGDVYLYWPIKDERYLPDETTLLGVVQFTRALLDANHNVLVHCHSGLNRASLVTGRTLVARGMEPADAVEVLRKRRDPNVLNNEVFLEWLLTQQAGS
jgi:protein-tyrosine phosphatase